MADDEVPPGGAEVGDDPPWDAWHPREVTRRLAGTGVRWCVAAGWALDLFRGEMTREHEDLEIAVPAGQFGLIRAALADFDIEVVGSGRRWPLDSPAFDVMIQTWVRERDTGIYRLDIFWEPHDSGTWICRRDRSIRLPYEQIIATAPDGIPCLAPRGGEPGRDHLCAVGQEQPDPLTRPHATGGSLRASRADHPASSA